LKHIKQTKTAEKFLKHKKANKNSENLFKQITFRGNPVSLFVYFRRRVDRFATWLFVFSSDPIT
jgi:hypothetical protein